MNTLATLSPLQPYVSADGTSYQSYYVPEIGAYLLLRKAVDGAYSYYSCVNETEYTYCWATPEQVPYVAQAPSGIDFSAIVLRDALQDTVNSNNAISQGITENQERQLARQASIEYYQKISAEKDSLTDSQLRKAALHVILDNPPVPESKVSVDNFPATYPVTGIFWQQTQPVIGPATNSELRASPLPVSLAFPQKQVVVVDNPTTSVSINNAITIANQPSTYPVTGAFWQATQPVSGPVTDAQLRTTPLPVSVAFPVSQHVTIDNPSISVNNQPSTYPVTGTFWQNTQPVSGPLTDTQLRSSPVPVTVAFPAIQRVVLDNPTTTITVANPVTTVAVSALPAGIGTSSNQLIANTSLNAIDGKLLTVSTAAKQDTTNTTLASIDSKLGNPLTVRLATSVTGGLGNKVVVASSIGTTATLVKASPGQVYGIILSNVSGNAVYLNMYNKATIPVANDIPMQIYTVPSNQTIQLSFPIGSTYVNGIAFTLTSNVAILGVLTGLLAANQVIVNMEYA